MDKGAMIADISDVQAALDMYDASSEILGYLPGGYWDPEQAEIIKLGFNAKFSDPDDEFSPVMAMLTEQSDLAGYLEMVDAMSFIMVFVFVLAMSIVLWNTGLIGGLRRYGEVGIRLAIGEEKGHIYRSMIWESILIGILGSAFGTIIGLGFSYWLQEVGIDISRHDTGSNHDDAGFLSCEDRSTGLFHRVYTRTDCFKCWHHAVGHRNL